MIERARILAVVTLMVTSLWWFGLWVRTIRRGHFELPSTWVDFWMYLIFGVGMGVCAVIVAGV